jgi:2-keto-4-pentenoate hydratase/2-oxohepta-3-ene-1,7-dioic acid hydratase in catechol pathway
MKLVTVLFEGREVVALLSGDKVIEVDAVLKAAGLPAPGDMLGLIDAIGLNPQIRTVLEQATLSNATGRALAETVLLAPSPRPRRNIFCLGKNYISHATEVKATRLSGSGIPKAPVYFTKMATPATAPGGVIECHHDVSTQVDYEAELVVIIGRQGRDIPAADAQGYIFGYTIINDVSARDVQVRHEQWFKGKNLDTFCPMGPCIADKNEIPFPVEVMVSCRVNGELMQNDSTGNLIFDIPFIISDLSHGLTLYPGDIISTGTPGGVGVGRTPPRFLKDGDVVVCSVEKIGDLVNTVRYR